MVNFTTGTGIDLKHLVIFDNESKIFAAGREQFGSKYILRLYLINEHTGEVFTRNGRTATWEIVSDERYSHHISEHVHEAFHGHNIPVYKIRGDFNA
jgi:hypothetical protein